MPDALAFCICANDWPWLYSRGCASRSRIRWVNSAARSPRCPSKVWPGHYCSAWTAAENTEGIRDAAGTMRRAVLGRPLAASRGPLRTAHRSTGFPDMSTEVRLQVARHKPHRVE
ncbi:hypothetical protein TNCT6_55380 [Streptomyces sp. 6-11-2]|nr:hypothetical protein TNCT6_55380 [Streptomyces sp. 6-11-2]